MKRFLAVGLAAVAAAALASCNGGGGAAPSTSGTSQSTKAQKTYSESELRNLVSGLKDSDGNDLKLYSPEQVGSAKNIAKLLLDTATVDPSDCKSLATAGLVQSVENGSVAVAISDSDKPRTASAQSSSQGPDAEQLLTDIRGKADKCSTFSVTILGQKQSLATKQLQATTQAAQSFGTVSTRGGNSSDMLMQVSGAQGRLLVVATKSGGNLGDSDQKELQDLVNSILQKAQGSSASPTSGSGSGSGTSTSTGSPTGSGSGSSTSTGAPTGSGSSSPSMTSTPSS
ncbi:MAG TPA: hypothetical protein VJQ61_12425 [Sinomonas sp.]|nr:hypothetical protein [Sinomonas sp.]